MSKAVVTRYTVASLCELVTGSSRALWLRTLIPDLVGRGVLVKHGKAWLGRQAEIEAALLDRLDHAYIGAKASTVAKPGRGGGAR